MNVWIELTRYMSAMFCVVIDEFCLYIEWLSRLGCVHCDISEFVISIALLYCRSCLLAFVLCHVFAVDLER